MDVNHPESQEDLDSNFESAHNLVEDAISGVKIAPRLLALAARPAPHTCLSSSSGGKGQLTAGQLSSGFHSFLCSVSRLGSALG